MCKLTFSKGIISEKFFELGWVFPSVRIMRTFGLAGLSPASWIKSCALAASSARSVRVGMKRLLGMLSIRRTLASLLWNASFAKVLYTLAFLANRMRPKCVASRLIFNDWISCLTKPLASMKSVMDKLFVLSNKIARSTPFANSQGFGATEVKN